VRTWIQHAQWAERFSACNRDVSNRYPVVSEWKMLRNEEANFAGIAQGVARSPCELTHATAYGQCDECNTKFSHRDYLKCFDG